MYKIDQNVHRFEWKLNRAVGNPCEKPQTTKTVVSSDSKRNHDNNEIQDDNKRKTYRKEKEFCATEHDPENKTQTVKTGVNNRPKRDRDKNGKTYWATASPRLTPSSQESRKPNNTEESNRIENPKAPSVFQASLGTVPTLENATAQVLFGDIGVPVSTGGKILKIDKNVCKAEWEKSNRAVGSPLGNPFRNPRTVKTKVSNGPTGNSNKRKTHRKNEQKTYQKEFQDSDCGRPPEGQSLNRESRIDWACKPDDGGTRPVKRKISVNRNGRKTYPRKDPDLQFERETDGTEEGDRILNPKAPSMPRAPSATAPILEVAAITTRFLQLSRDVGIPVSITMYEIDFRNTFGAAGKPPEKLRTVYTNVSNDRTRNQTVNTDVTGRTKRSRDEKEIKRETYHMGEQYDQGRPPEGQNPDRESRIDWAFKPDGSGIKTMKKVLVIIATGRKLTWNYRDLGIAIVTGRELTWGNRDLEIAMAENRARNSAGNGKSIGLIDPMDSVKTRKKIPKGQIEEKLTLGNRRNRGTGRIVADGHSEPAQRTKLNWARKPASGRNKNKVPPVCRYAMRLAEPQYGWQSRNAIGDAAVRLTLFLAAATKTDQSGTSQSATHRKLKFCQCVTNNVSCYSN
jgi:hypothetical protein